MDDDALDESQIGDVTLVTSILPGGRTRLVVEGDDPREIIKALRQFADAPPRMYSRRSPAEYRAYGEAVAAADEAGEARPPKPPL